MDTLFVILTVQMALALLCPGVLLHGRTLFACDIWVVMALPMMGLLVLFSERPAPLRKWFLLFFWIALVFGLSFIHGRYRTPISDVMMRRGILVPESDQFNGTHEAVIVLRFLSWITEGILVWWLVQAMETSARDKFKKSVARAMSWMAGIAAAMTVVSGLSNGFTEWLAPFYGYRGDLPMWRGRGFGPFRSPLEGGLTLSLCLLLLLSTKKQEDRSGLNPIGTWITGAGVLLTRTFTAIGALIATWTFCRFKAAKPRLKIVLATCAIVCLGLVSFLERDLMQLKWDDLNSRFVPWEVMLSTQFGHVGSAFLGHGFAPLNSDDAYIFVLFRMGLVGFAVLGYLAIRWGRSNWSRWSTSQREVLVFLLLTSLTLDTFIVRPVAMVFIAAALPLLVPGSGGWETEKSA